MKSRLQLLHEESLRTGLQAGERDSLRESLISYIDRNPVRDDVDLSAYSPVRSHYFSGFIKTGAFIALFIVLGVGVVYGAERSVPGDVLYPFKKGVNERVLGTLAFSDSSKAELEVDLASRRLDEAEKLNTKSKLSHEAKATIVSDFNIHMKAVGKHVEKLASEKKFDEVTKTTKHLETSLNAHAKILPMLSLVATTTNH